MKSKTFPAFKKVLLLVLILFYQLNLFSKDYKSKHGFSISYPKNWYLTNEIENYSSIQEAEEIGTNDFSIYNYQPATIDYEPELFKFGHLKIEVAIYSSREKNFHKWFAKQEKDTSEKIISISKIGIGNKKFYQVKSINLYLAFYEFFIS